MERASCKKTVHTCVVTENCLARAYLMELLRKDPGVKPIILDDLLTTCWPLNQPRVFVVDHCGLTLPVCECFRRLRSRYPSARFLVLGTHYDKEEAVRLMLLGAQGFLEQERAPKRLLCAVHVVAEGQLWVAPDILEAYLREVSDALCNSGERGVTLTPREVQILEMVRGRMSNKEIASLLKIAVSTVKFHLTNILSKQHAGGRRELLAPLQGEVWSKILP